MSATYVRRVVSAMILSATLVGAAAAQQTQPGAPGYPNNATGAPPLNNGTATQPGGFMDNGYRPTHFPEYYSDYGTGYPVVEVRAVPAAMARSAILNSQFRRAQTDLNVLILGMKKAWERSRDFVQAVSEEREAFEALEAARREALRSVMDDPAYQASVSLRQSLADQIEVRRQDKHVRVDELLAMANVKLDYAATASKMEAAALAASPDYQQARERLRRSSARLSELRYQLDQNVRGDQNVQMARQNVVDLRIAALGAEVYLEGVRDTRDIALAYAVWSHRNDRYKYLSYGYYGYNYTPSYGYQIGYPIGWNPYVSGIRY